jgi:hypothetical protein
MPDRLPADIVLISDAQQLSAIRHFLATRRQ